MEGRVVGAAGAAAAQDLALTTTVLPSRRIGRRVWSGHSVVARAVHVTYQQKTHVSGRIASMSGEISRGEGSIGGGGGSIGSSSESVATVVLRDEAGAERTEELPAAVAPREGTLLRLDRLEGRTFAVTNVSGRQPARWLLGPAAFVPMRSWRRRDLVCLVLALIAFAAGRIGWTVVFAALPAWRTWRIVETRRHWRELRAYMAAIAS